MFIVVLFSSSTGLAIVAESILRCGDLLSEKSCRHNTGSFFFFFVNQTFLVFINLKDRAAFLGLIMHFLIVDVIWERLIIVFCLFFRGIMSFYVSIGDVVFLVTSFPIFDYSVWLILSFRCTLFFSFFQFYWGSGHCTSEF